ncbi:MAG: 6-carboxytetrahydropterin synthase QueD [Armatimonadetes bacterium]|nr:6-carboxytetrahydropterin synthase QueD [Armatimonadota bacterium]
MGKFELTVTTYFSGAHYLRGYSGSCARLHGHNFRVEARVCGNALNNVGMVMDFKSIKALLEEITERLDHRLANEIPPFDTRNPTAENFASYIFEELAPRIHENGASLAAVGVWETDNYGVIYTPDR